MTYLLLGIVVFIAAIIQSTSGFGFGIFSMALLPLFLPYKEANILTLITVFCLQLFTIIKFRKHINFKLVITPGIAAIIFGSIGVHLMLNLSSAVMDLILGIFLCSLAFYMIFIANRIHLKKSIFNGFLAGSFGGFMDGMFAIGGPPMVAYFDSIIKSPIEYQATLQLYFLITTVNVILNNIFCGNLTSSLIAPLSISIICCLVATSIGIHFTQKISMKIVRRLAYTVMIFAGIYHFIKIFI